MCGRTLNEVADSIQTLTLQAENVRAKADLAKEISPVVQNPAANTDNPTASFLLFQKTEIFPHYPFSAAVTGLVHFSAFRSSKSIVL